MISKGLKKLVKGTALAGAMIFGTLVVAHTEASAQYRDYRNGRNGRYGTNRQIIIQPRYDRRNNAKIAYQRGYNDGFRSGLQSARYGNNGNRNYGNYGYGNYGYGNYSYGNYGNNGWGDSSIRKAYEKGFKKGYKDGRKRSRYDRGNSRWPF